MATESGGYRATPRRVAELQAEIAELRGEHGALLAALEHRLERVERRAVLGFALARGRIAAELDVLKQAENL